MTTTTLDQLPAATSMGALTLRVADLDAMTAYYRDAVRLTVLPGPSGQVTLGRGQVPILVLESSPELKHAAPRQAGLFHTAILFETEADLSAVVYSVASAYPGSFTGSADHLVSKAFYFNDPEGNGVELYWDRDRSTWSWVHGRVEMGSLMLDPNAYLRDHFDEEAVQQADGRPAKVGHVHLCVGDVAVARQFYVNQLGFETTAEWSGQALFVSAGKYHHHMAMNTWSSAGAGRRRATLGLGLVRMTLPTPDDLGALTERLDHHQVPVADDGRTFTFDDPWSNRIEVSAAS